MRAVPETGRVRTARALTHRFLRVAVCLGGYKVILVGSTILSMSQSQLPPQDLQTPVHTWENMLAKRELVAPAKPWLPCEGTEKSYDSDGSRAAPPSWEAAYRQSLDENDTTGG
jgi:hypothetical protein